MRTPIKPNATANKNEKNEDTHQTQRDVKLRADPMRENSETYKPSLHLPVMEPNEDTHQINQAMAANDGCPHFCG